MSKETEFSDEAKFLAGATGFVIGTLIACSGDRSARPSAPVSAPVAPVVVVNPDSSAIQTQVALAVSSRIPSGVIIGPISATETPIRIVVTPTPRPTKHFFTSNSNSFRHTSSAF